MTHIEIRLVKHLVETAREIVAMESGWAAENFTAFEMVMRHNRPRGPMFEVTDRQFDRCLRQAWMEFHDVRPR